MRKRFFGITPPAKMEFRHRQVRDLGDAIWYTYDYSIDLPTSRIEGRGTGVCRRTGGQWHILSMHNSIQQAEPGTKH